MEERWWKHLHCRASVLHSHRNQLTRKNSAGQVGLGQAREAAVSVWLLRPVVAAPPYLASLHGLSSFSVAHLFCVAVFPVGSCLLIVLPLFVMYLPFLSPYGFSHRFS